MNKKLQKINVCDYHKKFYQQEAKFMKQAS